MNENKYNPEGKDIRFIDSHYHELFRIPDGGYITITLDNGEQSVRKCKYRGKTHVDVGGETLHICQFAELMELAGNTYAPCPEPEVVAGYMITRRIPARDKVFVVGHNPDAGQPWVTWQGRDDRPGYDLGHYFSNGSDAWSDCFRRADAERRDVPYQRQKARPPKQKDRSEAR